MRSLNLKVFAFSFLCLFLVFSTAALYAGQDDTFEKAQKAYFNKDFKTAVKYFMEHVEKKPEPRAYYLLGYSLYKLNRHSEAIKYFDKAYILDPALSPVR